MKNKRIFLIGMIVIFILVILAMAFITFSIKKVNIEYNCAEEVDSTKNIENEILSIKGKNLFFTDEEDIKLILENYPMFELESFSKKYPSTINISIIERHKSFYIETDTNKIILSDDGIVLSTNAENVENLVKLNFIGDEEKKIDNVTIISTLIGKKIQTNYDGFLSMFFEIAKNINAVDCVNEANIYIKSLLNSFDIEFLTNTKVTLSIREAQDDGLEKSKLAINTYDNEKLDYKKSSNKDEVLVYKDNEGNLQVVFSHK